MNILGKELLTGSRDALARAITLSESTLLGDRKRTIELLSYVREHSRSGSGVGSLRIAVSGPPGAGKSTFIEEFGLYVAGTVGHKLAVLTIDPSSNRTGGSILADKTRMPRLSNHGSVYIRPSPSRGTLGGIACSTSEAIALCEAYGASVVVVETVGVGQSEYLATQVCDMFVVLLPPGAGDEIQGIKRGILENADLIIITKNDGDLINAAKRSYAHSLVASRFHIPNYTNWSTKVHQVSALKGTGIKETWDYAMDFKRALEESGEFQTKRRQQATDQFWTAIQHQLLNRLKSNPNVQATINQSLTDLQHNTTTPSHASFTVLDHFFSLIAK